MAGDAISATPTNPSDRAQIFARVSGSPRNTAASMIKMSGPVFPSTDEIPAPVRPGLMNMAAYPNEMPRRASATIPGHRRRPGRTGCRETSSTASSATPARALRKAAKRSGGAKARPSLMAE